MLFLTGAFLALFSIASVIAGEVEIDASGGHYDSNSGGDCIDIRPECPKMALREGCALDFEYMSTNCRKTCLLCGNKEFDGDRTTVHSIYSLIPQIAEGSRKADTLQVIEKSQEYMAKIFANKTMEEQWSG